MIQLECARSLKLWDRFPILSWMTPFIDRIGILSHGKRGNGTNEFTTLAALLHLIDARVREFYREPEVIFWVYGFPLILAMGLGYAFRGVEPEAPRVDVQATPNKAMAEELAKRLNNEKLGAEKVETQVNSAEECDASFQSR